MTAVEVAEAAIAKCYGYPSLADVPEGARWFRRLADTALAALFARAGIDGPGTIALTRDAEGRYGLKRATTGTAHWSASAGAWLYPLVPVEDDEEGDEPCDALGHDTETTHMDADGHTTWTCRRCGAEGWDDEEGDR